MQAFAPAAELHVQEIEVEVVMFTCTRDPFIQIKCYRRV